MRSAEKQRNILRGEKYLDSFKNLELLFLLGIQQTLSSRLKDEK